MCLSIGKGKKESGFVRITFRSEWEDVPGFLLEMFLGVFASQFNGLTKFSFGLFIVLKILRKTNALFSGMIYLYLNLQHRIRHINFRATTTMATWSGLFKWAVCAPATSGTIALITCFSFRWSTGPATNVRSTEEVLYILFVCKRGVGQADCSGHIRTKLKSATSLPFNCSRLLKHGNSEGWWRF